MIQADKERLAMRAPFPWFGGKSQAAPLIWERLGQVENYVEPFFGSGAVLLGRPHEARVETVNDKDALVSNFWRAIAAAPSEVAHHADWPVSEADLHARHLWLVERLQDGFPEWIMGEVDHYDTQVAGWWVWGMCAWIGSEFCSGNGPWGRDENGRLAKVNGAIQRQIPHLGDDGRGINKPTIVRQIPHLGNDGQGINRPYPPTLEWFEALQARLRNVRVCCGDWKRIMGPSVAVNHLCMRRASTVCGVVLDPPYAHSERNPGIYREDHDVAHEVTDWAFAHGDDPRLRIAVCGFDGDGNEALEDAGWTCAEWYKHELLRGGYGVIAGGDNHQQHRERVWFSPHCLGARPAPQMDLFEEMTA